MDGLDIKQLVLTIGTISEEKNLPEELVLDIVQQAIAAAWRRDHGDREQDVRAELNTNTGVAKIFIAHEVVDEVENTATEISVADAQELKKGAVVGDIVEETDEATSFGRVAAQTAKQVVLQKLLSLIHI